VSQPAKPNGESQGFDREAADAKARAFFDELWAEKDPWDLDDSALDQQRYARQLELLADRRYPRALEVGCAAGSFTRVPAPACDELVALDVSSNAIERARAGGDVPGVEFRLANVMELDLEQEGSWDLIVLTETAYYLGWIYPMFELGWLAHSLHEATRPAGRLLLANTIWRDEGIMSPWLIHAYRDLFARVGYEVEREEILRGAKESVELEVLITLFRRA
jgi:SAM-dependent methyltransferase